MIPPRRASFGLGLFLVGLAAPLAAQYDATAKLKPSDGALFDGFGHAVSIFGDRALAGAPKDDGAGTESGSAYVYARDAAGVWTLEAKLTASDTFAYQWFGYSVSLEGDRALVGAGYEDAVEGSVGSAYVFERDGSGAWSEAAKLVPSDAAGTEEFGISVSLSGDRALVGASHDSFGGVSTGTAYVFERDDNGNWTQVAKLVVAPGGSGFDNFGAAVSLSGDRALVGASFADDPFGEPGSAYVFERGAGGAWVQTAQLVPSDSAAFDEFGASVAILGDLALVGSPFEDGFLGDHSGSAYVFERAAGGAWTQAAKLVPSDGASGDRFGFSAALSADRAVVGAPSGAAAYVFERNPDLTWAQLTKLEASDGAPTDELGHAVSLSGNRFLVGAPYHDGPADSGAAYVFEPCSARVASSEVVRLGTPPNPAALLPGGSSGPVVGATWDPIIDHATFQPSALVDYLGITANPLNVHLPPYGTLLCDPALIVTIAVAAAGQPFAVPVPTECAYIGVSLCTQGASISLLSDVRLTNALDITIGTF